jgi:hypothetical protein
MHQPPVAGDFKDEHGKPNKLTIFRSNNMHMGNFEKGNQMAHSYLMNECECK